MSFIYIMWTNYWARVAALESRYSAAADIGLGGARPGHRPPNSRHSLARIDKEEVRRSGNETVAPVFLFSQSRKRPLLGLSPGLRHYAKQAPKHSK